MVNRACIFLLALTAVLALGSPLYAQNEVTEQLIMNMPEESEADPVYDGSLKDVDIFTLVTVNQSSDIEKAFRNYVENNSNRKLTGYRVRIFFDNSQNARTLSETVAREFAAEHPSMKVYRSHVSPYFKVTAGNFRTKDDAQKFARTIMDRYPSVFLVREHIHYPDL